MQSITFIPMSMSSSDSLSSPSSSRGPSRRTSLNASTTLTLTSPAISSSRPSTFKSFFTPRRKSKQAQISLIAKEEEMNAYFAEQANCTLLTLPYELRELIYLSLLEDEHLSSPIYDSYNDGVLVEIEQRRNNKLRDLMKGEMLVPGTGSTKSGKAERLPHPGRTALTRLMRTCRQLNMEATPILYNQTKINLTSLLMFTNFHSLIPTSSFNNIRTLSLRVRFPWLLYPQAGSMLAKAGEGIQHFNEEKWSSVWSTIHKMSTPGQGQLRHLTIEIKTTRYAQHGNWPSEPVPEIRDRLFAPLRAITSLRKETFVVEVSWPLQYAELPLPPTLNPETGEIAEIKRGEIAWWRRENIPFTLRETVKRPHPSTLTPPLPIPLPADQPFAMPETPTTPTHFTSAVVTTDPNDFDLSSTHTLVARATYAYLPDPAGIDDEIGFSKNELLRIKSPSGTTVSAWYLAKNENGDVGLVPSNYLTLLDENEVARLRRNGVPGLPGLDGARVGDREGRGEGAPVVVRQAEAGVVEQRRGERQARGRTGMRGGGLVGWARRESGGGGWGWS